MGWQEEVGQRRPRRLQDSATNAGQRGVHHPQRPAHLAASSAVGLEGRRCGHPRQGAGYLRPVAGVPAGSPAEEPAAELDATHRALARHAPGPPAAGPGREGVADRPGEP